MRESFKDAFSLTPNVDRGDASDFIFVACISINKFLFSLKGLMFSIKADKIHGMFVSFNVKE